jgi:hypothetical protein
VNTDAVPASETTNSSNVVREDAGSHTAPRGQKGETDMKPLLSPSLAVILAAGSVLLATGASTQTAKGDRGPIVPNNASPIFGVTIPAGYRQWELIAPSHRTDFNEIKGILGNAVAMKAYRERALPFPDGTILAKLAWKRVPSAEFGGDFVPGAATRIEFMVKDSKKYASTGGWGFGRFIDGKPDSEAQHQACFGCHLAHVKGHDLVFTRFAP